MAATTQHPHSFYLQPRSSSVQFTRISTSFLLPSTPPLVVAAAGWIQGSTHTDLFYTRGGFLFALSAVLRSIADDRLLIFYTLSTSRPNDLLTIRSNTCHLHNRLVLASSHLVQPHPAPSYHSSLEIPNCFLTSIVSPNTAPPMSNMCSWRFE
jgi:hypothetical protein